MTDRPDCRLVRAGETYAGKQGFNYVTGISAETAGARGLCMMLLTIRYGDRLERRMTVGAGDMLYIPAGMPHLPANVSDEPCVAVIARTDPNEQESVVLLPELEELVGDPEPARGSQV